MEQEPDVAKLLKEIRDTQRTLTEEVRAIRQWFDNWYGRQKKAALILLAFFLGVIILVFILRYNFSGASSQATSWERQNAEYQRQLKKQAENLDRIDAESIRQQKLQRRWERQTDQVDELIRRWKKKMGD
jgi:hypothetical protein